MSYNFDDFITDAKGIYDKVAQKATEAVDYSKTQIDRASLRSKIKDKYAELGKKYYDMHENNTDENKAMKALVEEIASLKKQLAEADVSVNAKKCKACSFCETNNDAAALYCSKCGEKL